MDHEQHLREMCNEPKPEGKKPLGVVRGQFMKIYEQLQARDRRLSLLPESLKKSIVKTAMPALVSTGMARIGRMEDC